MAGSKTLEELNKLFSEAEQVDSSIFAEQRSNVLLKAGEHYNKKSSRYWNRIRDMKSLSDEQKVRITKNHIQKIVKSYINNFIAHAPGVIPTPKNEKEQSDIKAAHLNKAVWQDICDRFEMSAQVYEDADDLATIGEVAMKVFWDPYGGKFIGWEAEPMLDEMGEQVYDEMGNPQFARDEAGEMVASKTPVYSGDLVFERVYGFNLLRAKEAKSMDEAKVWIVRKMADIEDMKKKVGNDPDKLKAIQASIDDTMLVFDGVQGGYTKSENQVSIREYYWKPCYEYPQGYFVIATPHGKLFEGELPFGIFPLIYTGFDPAQTTARHFSIIKTARPYQVEINRASSKMVEHQITMGDDKLLIQSGSKLSSGGSLPGIRGVQYTGMKPEVLPGRTGEQFLGYIAATLTEMYEAVNLRENDEELMKQADPFGMLFFSLRDKKKFSMYLEKFERFQIKKCKLALELAKKYYDEQRLVPAIGKNEIVNIAEFKNTNDLSFEIKLKPMVNDAETMFGKQLVMSQIIQYAGGQLGKEDIGRIIRNMPFGNADESFSDMTLNYDSASNMLLALDRGEEPEANMYDDAPYMIKRLTARIRASDFKFLDPRIQENYRMMLQIYEGQEAEKQRKIMEAQKGFIPSGGAKVKVDYYVASPNNPEKTERATLPAEAVNWLIQRLAEQGSSQQDLRDQNMGAVADISEQLTGAPAYTSAPQQTQTIPPPRVSEQANMSL